MAGGNTGKRCTSAAKKLTVDLKMISTMPGERSGGGGHLLQGTRRPGHSLVARQVSVAAYPESSRPQPHHHPTSQGDAHRHDPRLSR
jgi:hypothetical protein